MYRRRVSDAPIVPAQAPALRKHGARRSYIGRLLAPYGLARAPGRAHPGPMRQLAKEEASPERGPEEPWRRHRCSRLSACGTAESVQRGRFDHSSTARTLRARNRASRPLRSRYLSARPEPESLGCRFFLNVPAGKHDYRRMAGQCLGNHLYAVDTKDPGGAEVPRHHAPQPATRSTPRPRATVRAFEYACAWCPLSICKRRLDYVAMGFEFNSVGRSGNPRPGRRPVRFPCFNRDRTLRAST